MADFVKVGKSKISGNGVFAMSDFKKGQRICFLTGKMRSLNYILNRIYRDDEDPADPLGAGEEEYIELDEVPRNFNHSCNPNSFIRGKNELIAMRNIKKGEEINYDYSTTMADNKAKIEKAGFVLWTCKCNCKAKNCRKIIDQFTTLPEKRKKFYLENKYAPDFVLNKFKKALN